jgi:hypothetical protein
MTARWVTPLLALCTATLLAQSPAPAVPPGSQTHANDLGFSYNIPAGWDVVDAQATLPMVKDQATQNAASAAEKKGVECVQVLLTGRHGNPVSVIVEVALPFGCFGQEMTEKDLPGFASGASEGLQQTFDIGEPVYGSYTRGTHNVWIERAKGTPKGHPELPYTVEIACSLLKKAAVCWMTMAADDASLATFEHGAATLDGDAPIVLVPASAFDVKPS